MFRTLVQRAMCAARLANLKQGRHESNAPIGALVSQPDAAAMLNVGRRSVQRARANLSGGQKKQGAPIGAPVSQPDAAARASGSHGTIAKATA